MVPRGRTTAASSAYGTSEFKGSMAATPTAASDRRLATTPNGPGYWIVAAEAAVFGFGDAASSPQLTPAG